MSNPGSIKQDPYGPTIAVCTSLNNLDPLGAHDWMCMHPYRGSWYVKDEYVTNWTDIYAA